MNKTALRLERMSKALTLAQGHPGNETVQYEQLRLIMHDARAMGIPIMDWLATQTLPITKNTPERFSCKKCEATFVTKAALNGHQRVHRNGGDHE